VRRLKGCKPRQPALNEYVARLRQLGQNLGTTDEGQKIDAHKEGLATLSDHVGATSSRAEEVDNSSIEYLLNT
jgi:hypothetical protein